MYPPALVSSPIEPTAVTFGPTTLPTLSASAVLSALNSICEALLE
jgi:hypothetical protein